MIHHLWTALQTGVSLRAKEPAGPATTQYGTETQFVSEAQRTRSDESRLTAHVSGPQMTGKARCSKKIGRETPIFTTVLVEDGGDPPQWRNGVRGLQMECFLVARMIGHRGRRCVRPLLWAVPRRKTICTF